MGWLRTICSSVVVGLIAAALPPLTHSSSIGAQSAPTASRDHRTAPPRLAVDVASDGTFTARVDGVPWLVSSNPPLELFHSGAPQKIRLSPASPAHATGSDALGNWSADLFTGTAGLTPNQRTNPPGAKAGFGGESGESIRVVVAIRQYPGINAVTFDVTLPDGAQDIQRAAPNTSDPSPLPYGTVAPGLSFPLFEMPDKTQPNSRADLGWLTITGDQSGRASWGWFEDGETPPQAGRGAGPVVLYADPRQTAVAISPLTHVAAAVNHYIGTNQSTEGGLWRWGPSGELNSLPAGFRHRTLLVLGAHGVTDAWSAVGGTLQALQPGVAEARRAVQGSDPNVNLLSFYTDAGDAYMSGASAELLVQSVHEIRRQGVPIGLVQLDDWAHQSTGTPNCGCLSRWAGDPKYFPDGWRGFSEAVDSPLALYLPGAGICPGDGARVFNVSTLNGSTGAPGTLFEVPTPADARKYFAEIMSGGLAQGMGHTLEIDFLDFSFLQVPEFRETLEAFPQVFGGLGEAAAEAGVAVELCMTLPHHALAAAGASAITSMRVGPDYDWPTNCDIGVTSFLPWSVGLRPSKDSFMSSNRSKVDLGPPFLQHNLSNMGELPLLNAIIATLSTGPVGLGDGVNSTDPAIALPSCDAAGRLLQPDKPLTAIDATFSREGQESRGAPNGRCKSAWMSGADGGAIWTSFTRLGDAAGANLPSSDALTHYVLAINVSRPWTLARTDLWPPALASSTYVSHRWGRSAQCVHGTRAVASGCVELSTPSETLLDLQSRCEAPAGACKPGESPFVFAALHTVRANGWVVWEEGKYVSVSNRRFARVTERPNGLEVQVRGGAGERAHLVALAPVVAAGGATKEWTVRTMDVLIGKTGVGLATLGQD